MAIENISPSEFEGIKNDFASGGFEQKLANLENVLLYEQGDQIPDMPDMPDMPEWVCRSWGIVKPALKLAKLFTPDHIDQRIDRVLEIDDHFCYSRYI
tara:strand:+ start:24478 stop:24771 length:294 start_codon:yes stop_codon:yes gene_type:complete